MNIQMFCGSIAITLRNAANELECLDEDDFSTQRAIASCIEKAIRLEAIANCNNIVQGLKDAGIKF